MADETNITTGPDAASNQNSAASNPLSKPMEGVGVSNTTIPVVQSPTAPAQPLQEIPIEETELERSKHALDTSTAPHSGIIGDDIAKILKDVKLPDRSDFRGMRDTPKQNFVTPSPLDATLPKDPKSSSETAPTEEYSIVAPLRTLKNDLQRIIRTRRITVVRAAALEQEKKRPTPIAPIEKKRNSARTRRMFGLFFASVVLVVLGCAALFGTYIISTQQSSPINVQSTSILFAEQTVTLPIDTQTPNAIKQVLASAKASPGNGVGSITRIVPTLEATSSGVADQGQTRPATLTEFLAALGTQVPPDLLRALSDDYFFGMYNTGQNTPLFVIPVISYDRAFAGMLAWEKTLNTDLSPIYTPVTVLTTGPDGLPTERVFQDIVMHNYDVRALRNDAGDIVLYYSFPTPKLLIIAENPYTFTEVLSRLQAARKL